MNSRSAFKFGLLSGLGIMFAIGFFITLGLLVNAKTGGFKLTNDKPDTTNNAAQPTQPTETGEINLQPVADADWLRGDKNAEITIVEFSDIDCPYCQRFHDTMNQVLDEYDGDVNWVYRHFPLTSLHPNSFTKSEATECVGKLGGNDKFWEYLDKLFADQTITVNKLASVAGEIGVSSTKVQECMDAHEFTNKIQNQTNQATTAGGRGTPYGVILAGDQKIPINGALPIENIRTQLDSILQ